MASDEKPDIRKNFDLFDYDNIICLELGSRWTKVVIHDIKNEGLALDKNVYRGFYQSACLYSCKFRNFDNAIFEAWGDEADKKRRNLNDAVYIDTLREKMELLFQIQPDPRKSPEEDDEVRFYRRAVIQYLQELSSHINKSVLLHSRRDF